MTTILATIALAIAPVFEFTSDSAYKKDKILDLSVSEETVLDVDADGQVLSEEVFYTLNVKENYVLGYEVFNDPNTAYVDGVKIDGTFLSEDWSVKDFDPNKKHVVTVKTVYANDISGWFAKAKDGDFSALMSNPVTVLQFGYYVLAGLSLLLGGLGLAKSKKKKIKTADEIAAAVSKQSDRLREATEKGLCDIEASAMSLVSDVVSPLVETLSAQNETLIKATVLARSGDEASTLALLDLLKESGVKGVDSIADNVKERIKESKAKAEETKRQAMKALKEAVSELPAPTDPNGGYDGTSI